MIDHKHEIRFFLHLDGIIFCNYIIRYTFLDSLFHLLVTENTIMRNFKRQSSSLVPHCEITNIFDKKQPNKFIISESKCFV